MEKEDKTGCEGKDVPGGGRSEADEEKGRGPGAQAP